jgi:DNA polymerase (family 10)
MDKKEISNALDEAAVLMELAGDNPFRVRAYSNASRIVRAYAGDLAGAVADGSIRSIKGIGPNIAAHIAELLESDDPPFIKELRSQFPAGVLEMLRIPGLGPKKIRVLMEELDITSVGELEYACRENRLLDLPGFGLQGEPAPGSSGLRRKNPGEHPQGYRQPDRLCGPLSGRCR